MADFVCPDVLGSLPTFERVFGGPISKSRDRNASTEEKNIGEKRSEYVGTEAGWHCPLLRQVAPIYRVQKTPVGETRRAIYSFAACSMQAPTLHV